MRACKSASARSCAAQLKQAGQDKGAAVVMDPASGDLLAAVSYPLPPDISATPEEPTDANPYLDRARYGLYPPGSTFKVVTAMAALRKNPQLARTTYACVRLPDGRVGNFIKGSNRPIRDDVKDQTPHGTRRYGARHHGLLQRLFRPARDVRCRARSRCSRRPTCSASRWRRPNTAAQLKKSLPQSSYGQGQVVASPFQMARVAATVANGGMMPQGRWVADETNARTGAAAAGARSPMPRRRSARFMREVVTDGHGPARGRERAPWPGKTGTAELANDAVARLVHRLRAVRRRRTQDRVLRPGGEWSVRRHGGGARRFADRGRRGQAGADSPMSLFSEIEKTIERGFRRWTERMFGPGQSDDLVIVHRAILEEIEGKVQTMARGERVFPFTRVLVTLVAADAERRAILQSAFGERLGEDVREALKCVGLRYSARLRGGGADVRIRATRPFDIEYSAERPAPGGAGARARWWSSKARRSARSTRWTRRGRTSDGCAELTDADHRVTRRNDVVFEEGADEANGTVSRRHAHIGWRTASTASATTAANSGRACSATGARSKSRRGIGGAKSCAPATKSTWAALVCGSSAAYLANRT